MARRPSSDVSLSIDAIIEATIEYIDTNGLDAFTMRALATQIGVYPAALYYHVDSKAKLVGLASSRLFGDLPVVASDTGWQTALASIAHSIRRIMFDHPNFAPVFGLTLAADSTPAIPFIEGLLGVLSRTGLSDENIVAAYNAYLGLIIGWVTVELSGDPGEGDDADRWRQGVEHSIVSAGTIRNPNLARLLPLLLNRAFMLRWESGETAPLDNGFEFLLDCFIAGLDGKSRR